MLKFNENHLSAELTLLPAFHRTAFAASCCERLVPNFTAFSRMEKWGDPAILEQALKEIWNFLIDGPPSEEQLRELKQRCYTQVPNSNQLPDSLFISAAQNAVGGIIYTLECFLDNDVKWAALTGRISVETIDTYLYLATTPYLHVAEHISVIEASFEKTWGSLTEYQKIPLRIAEEQKQKQTIIEWIQMSPLMIAELEHQQRDIEMLKSLTRLDSTFLEALRNSSVTAGIRPLDRFKIRSR